jgi:endoglucanase
MLGLWKRFHLRTQTSGQRANRSCCFRPKLEALEDRTLLSASAFVRVNQVGYIASLPKRALLMASGAETGATFQVRDSTGSTVLSAPIGANLGSWNSAYPNVYLLDFSSITTAGTYSIAVTGPIETTSLSFAIDTGNNLYTGLLPNALFFYQAQQDGPNVNGSVMGRQPSHLTDASATIYNKAPYSYVGGNWVLGKLTKVAGAAPSDVSGGWFDAGDYLKFVETTSYTTAMMLLAVRDYPSLFTGGSADFATEARVGLDWLLKMWDDSTRTLYYQVGIGDGNSKYRADHDLWRLPEQDDQLQISRSDTDNPKYFIKYRPVFQAGPAGSPISPNLAGRLAAAFALGFQVYQATDPTYANKCLFAAEHVFDLAQTSNADGHLLTTSPGGPNGYYPEVEWRDDLELGATELYFATALGNLPTGLPHTNPMFYLKQAATWAHAYLHSPLINQGAHEPLNLYDVGGLAHYELYRAITQAGNPSGLAVTQADLLGNLKSQLEAGMNRAKQDPFGFGLVYAGGLDLVPHALGYALEASFYDELAGSGDPLYTSVRDFGQHQLDWVLGANAWGASFVVGAGTTYPMCLHHQIANLYVPSGGGMAPLLGATVDGPSVSSNFFNPTLTFPNSLPSGPDAPRECGGKSPSQNPLKAFNGKGVIYWDDVVAWPSAEPANDYTALTILAFARQVAGGPASPRASRPSSPRIESSHLQHEGQGELPGWDLALAGGMGRMQAALGYGSSVRMWDQPDRTTDCPNPEGARAASGEELALGDGARAPLTSSSHAARNGLSYALGEIGPNGLDAL